MMMMMKEREREKLPLVHFLFFFCHLHIFRSFPAGYLDASQNTQKTVRTTHCCIQQVFCYVVYNKGIERKKESYYNSEQQLKNT